MKAKDFSEKGKNIILGRGNTFILLDIQMYLKFEPAKRALQGLKQMDDYVDTA